MLVYTYLQLLSKKSKETNDSVQSVACLRVIIAINKTGLGLSISHSIIDNHKGAIDVKSEMGKGSSFVVILPVNQKGNLNV